MKKLVMKKCYIYEIISICFLVTLTFVIAMKSPLNPWTNGVSGTDSSVFKYVAMVISKGGMPYKDAFDHKGPLLYIINILGQFISFYRGIWVIECIFIFGTFYMMYKTARFFVSRFSACFIVVTAISPLTRYFEGGNLTEEYAMVFIAISVYIFLDYFLNGRVSKLQISICGFCFGAVLMLRANMISLWAVFCISILIWNIIHLKKIPWNYLLYFLLGSSVLIIPLCIWLIKEHAFSYFIHDYILFNMKYSSVEERARYTSIMTFLDCNIFLVSLVSVVYLIKKKINLFFNISYLIYILVTLITITLSGRSYGHYGMILIPMFTYPLSQLYSSVENSKKEFIDSSVVLLIILTLAIFPNLRTNLDEMMNAFYYPNSIVRLDNVNQTIVNLIQEYTAPEDKIIVIGNADIYYVLSHRLAASRYSYQAPVAEIDEVICQEFISDIVTNKPRMVILTNEAYEPYRSWFTTINQYEQIYLSEGSIQTGVYILKNETGTNK